MTGSISLIERTGTFFAMPTTMYGWNSVREIALSSVLPGVSYDRGMQLANRVHDTGQAIVWSGHKEQAELYWTQLEGLGLTMAPLEQ